MPLDPESHFYASSSSPSLKHGTLRPSPLEPCSLAPLNKALLLLEFFSFPNLTALALALLRHRQSTDRAGHVSHSRTTPS